MLRRLTSCLTALGLFVVSLAPLASNASAAPAQRRGQQRRQSKVAPEFAGASAANGNVRVIVQTKGRPSAAHDEAITSKRGAMRATFDALNAVVAELPAAEVVSLAARADVEYVSPDRTVKAQLDVTRETTGAALAQAAALGTAESPGVAGDTQFPGVTGKGVTSAVLDSGIDASHPDFRRNNKSRVLAAVDFTSAGGGVKGKGVANRPVLTNGIMLGDSIMMSDGIMLSDGVMVSDGIMLADGIMISDGILASDGIMVSDGIILTD